MSPYIDHLYFTALIRRVRCALKDENKYKMSQFILNMNGTVNYLIYILLARRGMTEKMKEKKFIIFIIEN